MNYIVTATQEAACSVMKGEEVSVTGAILASQIAASINAKVGAAPAKAADAFLPVGTILPKRATDEDGDQLPGAARCVARNISKEDTQSCNCLLSSYHLCINDLNYAYQTH